MPRRSAFHRLSQSDLGKTNGLARGFRLRVLSNFHRGLPARLSITAAARRNNTDFYPVPSYMSALQRPRAEGILSDATKLSECGAR